MKWYWKVVGAIVAFSAAFSTFTFWAYVRSMHVKPASAGTELGQGYDVISIQLEILSVAVTAFGIFLGVAAIVGYQSIKSAAEDKARKVAADTVDKHVQILEDWKRGFTPTAPLEPAQEIGTAVEVQGEGTVDGRTAGAGDNQELSK